MRSLIVLFALALVSGRALALEIWLACTERCNTCGIYERVAQQRGYGDVLHYGTGNDVQRIPIRSVDKSALAPEVIAQLPEHIGPKNPYWDITLTVLIMDTAGAGEATADRTAMAATPFDEFDLLRSQASAPPPVISAKAGIQRPGRVLMAGNIADSADNRELRHSDAVMFPPAEPADDNPALRAGAVGGVGAVG